MIDNIMYLYGKFYAFGVKIQLTNIVIEIDKYYINVNVSIIILQSSININDR